MFSWTMSEGGELDARPVRAFLPRAGLQVDESAWPASVPAMAQLLREGLEVPAGLTVLVGENGSGKSTVIESLAEAYGLNPQGGSAQARLFRVRRSEPGVGGPPAPHNTGAPHCPSRATPWVGRRADQSHRGRKPPGPRQLPHLDE